MTGSRSKPLSLIKVAGTLAKVLLAKLTGQIVHRGTLELLSNRHLVELHLVGAGGSAANQGSGRNNGGVLHGDDYGTQKRVTSNEQWKLMESIE